MSIVMMQFVTWNSRPVVIDGPRAWAFHDAAMAWTEVDRAAVVADGVVLSPEDFIAVFGDLDLPSAMEYRCR